MEMLQLCTFLFQKRRMNDTGRIFGQAGEKPTILPKSLLKKLTVKDRGNAPMEVLKSFEGNQHEDGIYASIMVKLGPGGRVQGSKWVTEGAMEEVKVDVSDLTGITGECGQKLVAKLDLTNLNKFDFGVVSGNMENLSMWRGSEETGLVTSIRTGKEKAVVDPDAIKKFMEKNDIKFSIR